MSLMMLFRFLRIQFLNFVRCHFDLCRIQRSSLLSTIWFRLKKDPAFKSFFVRVSLCVGGGTLLGSQRFMPFGPFPLSSLFTFSGDYSTLRLFCPRPQWRSVPLTLIGPDPSGPYSGPPSSDSLSPNIHTVSEPMFLFLFRISCISS